MEKQKDVRKLYKQSSSKRKLKIRGTPQKGLPSLPSPLGEYFSMKEILSFPFFAAATEYYRLAYKQQEFISHRLEL